LSAATKNQQAKTEELKKKVKKRTVSNLP